MAYLGVDVGGGSVKAACVHDGCLLWQVQSSRYANPSSADVTRAIAECLDRQAKPLPSFAAVGLCVPGILNADASAIELSVNLPRLNGIPLQEIVAAGLSPQTKSSPVGEPPAPNLRVLNDSTATALDLYLSRRLTGRLFTMVLGTGVGVCVIDEPLGGQPPQSLRVDGDSPGHFGQMDVSFPGATADTEGVVGPDGGAGSLEGFVGATVLADRYGTGPDALSAMSIDDPPARALVRAIRIAHAMYRPHHILLAGGVGIRLKHLVADLHRSICRQLTSIARKGWTLDVGENDFHAAAGAARAASYLRATDR